MKFICYFFATALCVNVLMPLSSQEHVEYSIDKDSGKRKILHLIYRSEKGDFIKLSDGRMYYVEEKKNQERILTWSFSDELSYYREGIFFIVSPILNLSNNTQDTPNPFKISPCQ